MYITKALENYLKDYPALKTVHSGQVWAGRLAPEGTVGPYQTFFVVSDPRENKRLGIPCPRFQINNFSPTYAASKQMAELTYEALDGFGGVMGGVGGITVEHAFYDDQHDDYEPDTHLHNVHVEVVIIYRKV